MRAERQLFRCVSAALATLIVAGCAGRVHHAAPIRTASRAVAVYRTIAESIYVRSTNRVVAVATTPLDTVCDAATCPDLRTRWGVETLWWARGDSADARDARADLLGNAAAPTTDMRDVPTGRPMLLEADPGDVPTAESGAAEWVRFRATHADAAGALRVSPVGFSRNGQTAIAFVDWRCGPTCGHRLSVALRATSDTTWAIDEMLLVSSTQQR
ncbi:MAG TPA: hypothetical protein VGG84_16415 [Gemmatimonadaceae bacterium]